MVPYLIEICLEEVKKRGIKEVGIYRMAGSESESKELMEKIVQADMSIGDCISLMMCAFVKITLDRYVEFMLLHTDLSK